MIAPIQRAGIAALVVIAMVGFVPLAAQAGPAKGPPNPLADPSTDTQPSQRFVNACSAMRTSTAANKRCDKAALKDFDKVRKKEGLGPMTLPHDFASLSVPSQLLAISDIERVDRGRRAVKGRSKALDRLAQQGANHDEDPPFPNPFTGNSGGANWADAGNSALLDDFYWMYDDGLGSFNADCTRSDQSGCWGHRHDILNAYDGPVIMGAAVSYQSSGFGTSMTEEFIGGDTGNRVNVAPTWRTISGTFPRHVRISASRTTVRRGQTVVVTGKVTTFVGHRGVGKQRVKLERRAAGGGAWRHVATGRTGPNGVVRFTVHPAHAEALRLQAVTSQGANDGASAAIRIAIT